LDGSTRLDAEHRVSGEATGMLGGGVDGSDGWVVVALMGAAADLLGARRDLPVLEADVHGCLRLVAGFAGHGVGAGAYRVADAAVAVALLTQHLVRSGLVGADAPGGPLGGWLVGVSAAGVARELRAAAGSTRLCLLADQLGSDGLAELLLALVRGAGR
jgi:hypothetical protein